MATAFLIAALAALTFLVLLCAPCTCRIHLCLFPGGKLGAEFDWGPLLKLRLEWLAEKGRGILRLPFGPCVRLRRRRRAHEKRHAHLPAWGTLQPVYLGSLSLSALIPPSAFTPVFSGICAATILIIRYLQNTRPENLGDFRCCVLPCEQMGATLQLRLWLRFPFAVILSALLQILSPEKQK